MHVGFRVDSSSEIGLGHVSRCLALTNVLTSHNYQVSFISNQLAEHSIQLLERLGISRFMLDNSTSKNQGQKQKTRNLLLDVCDASQTKAIAEDQSMDLLIVDHYGANSEWFGNLRNRTFRLASICDFPAPAGLDAVIDYGFDASFGKHPLAKTNQAQLLLGPDFVLINPSSLPVKTAQPASKRRGEVLVALGSGVSNSQLMSVASSLSAVKIPNTVRLIVPTSKEEALEANGIEFTVAPQSLDRDFDQAIFCVTAGGLTMYERLARGIPGFTLETADNQSMSLDAARSQGITETMTIAEAMQNGKLIEKISSGIKSIDCLTESVRLRSKIDFFGALRTAYVLGLLENTAEPEIRDINEADDAILLRWANEEVTRKNSFDRDFIDPESHVRWLGKQLASGNPFYIFHLHGIPMGFVRMENDDEGLRLSYGLDLNFRGKGFAKQILNAALTRANPSKPLKARTSARNMASEKALISVGFRVITRSEETIELQYKPLETFE
jgi:UDP-2,4-diacetamido-2,4,6-trideoxy-beta-L-altropyranose hydrolase